MYVTNVHGCRNAVSAATWSVVRKAGLTNSVTWKRNTTRLATISRRTHGVMPNIRCGSIASLSPARAPRVPREPADPLAQLRKLDPRSPGGLGEEAGARHAGERVRLQAKDVALGAQSEVDARVPPELEGPVSRERQLLELARQRRIELRGEDLLRHPGRVLALVVEQLVLRNDLTHRQRHVTEHPHRQLPPGDELLRHHLGIERFRDFHRRVQPFGVAHQRHPHGGAHLRRFDDHRPSQRRRHILGGDGAHDPRGSGPPRRAEQPLGEVLVHGERARQRPAAGIGHGDHVEHRLQDPPFTTPRVQAQEQHVRTGDLFEPREPVREHRALAPVELRHRGRLPADRGREQPLLVGGGEEPGHRIDDPHRMPATPQRLHDLGGAGERDRALRRRTARDHRDPHQWMPASWWRTSYRVTIPAILPSRRTSAAGVSRESRVVSRSTGRSTSTTGNGASITSWTGWSSVAGSSSARAMSPCSDTAPTPSPTSSTGSCDTLYVLIRFNAWRTVAVGATEISGGAPEFRASRSWATDTRSASRIWFSCSHSSLKTFDRYRSPVSASTVTTSACGSFTRRATSSAATTLTPVEPPVNRASSLARRRTISMASLSDTVIHSSITSQCSEVGSLSPPIPSTL